MSRERARVAYALRHITNCPPGKVCDYKEKCPACWEEWIYAEKV